MSKCLWLLHFERDTHVACPVCLRMLHVNATLANPQSGAHCHLLWKTMVGRHVAFQWKVLRSIVACYELLLLETNDSPTEFEPDSMDGASKGVQSWGIRWMRCLWTSLSWWMKCQRQTCLRMNYLCQGQGPTHSAFFLSFWTWRYGSGWTDACNPRGFQHWDILLAYSGYYRHVKMGLVGHLQ